MSNLVLILLSGRDTKAFWLKPRKAVGPLKSDSHVIAVFDLLGRSSLSVWNGMGNMENACCAHRPIARKCDRMASGNDNVTVFLATCCVQIQERETRISPIEKRSLKVANVSTQIPCCAVEVYPTLHIVGRCGRAGAFHHAKAQGMGCVTG